MSKIFSFSRIAVVFAVIIACQGCGGGSTDANAPTAGAEGGAGGEMPSSYEGGPTAQAGSRGSNEDAGMLAGGSESGREGDGYNPNDDGSLEGMPPSFGDDGGTAGMENSGGLDGADGYGANYAAGMPGSGVGGREGYPGDDGTGFGPGMGQMALKDPAPPEDADNMTKAKYAFAIGKEAAAHQYLYAHILANDADAGSLLKQIRWLPSGLRPSATTRFAAAVVLEAPNNLADLKPIGTSQMGGAGGGGGGYGGEMGMSGGPQGNAGPGGRTFQDITGGFGDAVVAAFETRWSAGDFGTIFNEVTPIAPLVRGQGGFGGMEGGGFSGGASGFGVGPGFDGGESFGPGDGSAGGARPKTVAGKSIVPGLLYLGVGSESELNVKAQKEGIDALLLFEVTVQANRLGVIQNDTRARLILVGGKSIGATQKLNNVKIERAQMTGGSNDVEKNVTVLFKKLDNPDSSAVGLKLADLPPIKPEHAKARIGKIVASKPKDILLALTEFRLYHSLGLITDAEKSQAYQLVLEGSDGEVLATGAEEDRIAILNAKLPAYK